MTRPLGTNLMHCPKCRGTGTQFEYVSEGYFRPPTPRFRCQRCAFTAWGPAALDAAAGTVAPVIVTLPEPAILELPAPTPTATRAAHVCPHQRVVDPDAPKLCRWPGCDRLKRRHGICDRCRNRLRRRMTTEEICHATDADIAAVAARFTGGHGAPNRSDR